MYRYSGHWWFMLQLLILTIIAPLIWKILQKKTSTLILFLLLIILSILQGLERINIPYVVFYAFIYYLCGAYIAIYKPDILLSKHRPRVGFLIVLLAQTGQICLHYFGLKKFYWCTSLPFAIGLWWLFNYFKIDKQCEEKVENLFSDICHTSFFPYSCI